VLGNKQRVQELSAFNELLMYALGSKRQIFHEVIFLHTTLGKHLLKKWEAYIQDYKNSGLLKFLGVKNEPTAYRVDT